MPKLPGATSQVQSGGLLRAPASTAGARGEAIARGAAGVSNELDEIVQRNRLLEAEKVTGEFAIAEAAAFEEAKTQAEPGGAGFTEAYRESFERRRASIIDSIGEQAVKNMVSEKLISMRTRQVAAAEIWEADARAKKAATDLTSILQGRADTMLGTGMGPEGETIDELLMRNRQTIENSGIPADRIPEILRQAENVAVFNYGLHRLDTDDLGELQQFQDELREPSALYDDNLTPQHKYQLMQRVNAKLDNEKSKRGRKQEMILMEYERSGYGGARFNQFNSNYSDPAWLKAQFPEKSDWEIQSIAKRMENSDRVQLYLDTARFSSAEERAQDLAAERQRLQDDKWENFDENSKYLAAVEKAQMQMNDQLRSDAFAFVSDNPNLNNAERELRVAMESQNPELVAEAWDNYYDAAEAEQLRQGVDPINFRYMSNAEANELKSYLTTSGAGSQEIMNKLLQYQARAGSRWPKMVKEFAGGMDGSILAAVAAISTGNTNEALNVLNLRSPDSIKNLNELVAKDRRKDMDTQLATQMSPLFQSMSIKGDSQLATEYKNVIQAVALDIMNKNPQMPSNTAVANAFDSVFGGYAFKSGLVLERNKITSEEQAEIALNYMAANPDFENIKIPESYAGMWTDEEAAEQYADAFAEGSWVNYDDGFIRMARIVAPNNELRVLPVLDKNGKVRVWSYADLDNAVMDSNASQLEMMKEVESQIRPF